MHGRMVFGGWGRLICSIYTHALRLRSTAGDEVVPTSRCLGFWRCKFRPGSLDLTLLNGSAEMTVLPKIWKRQDVPGLNCWARHFQAKNCLQCRLRGLNPCCPEKVVWMARTGKPRRSAELASDLLWIVRPSLRPDPRYLFLFAILEVL